MGQLKSIDSDTSEHLLAIRMPSEAPTDGPVPFHWQTPVNDCGPSRCDWYHADLQKSGQSKTIDDSHLEYDRADSLSSALSLLSEDGPTQIY